MKDFKKIVIISVITSLVVLFIVSLTPQKPLIMGSMDTNRIKVENVTTDGSVEVGTSSTLILATSTDRAYVKISNFSSTGVFLSLDGSPAVDSAGIYLASSTGEYEITPEKLFIGPIYGIATTSASTVTVVEASGN